MKISSQIVLTFLLNACWQVTVIAALASLSSWLLRNCAARHRHLVWVTALILSLGIPVTTSFTLSSEPLPQTSTSGTTLIEQRTFDPFVELERTSKPGAISNENTYSLNRPLALVLIGIYLSVVLYSALSLVRAWVTTRRIRRTATEIIGDHRVSNILDRCAPAVPRTAVKVCTSEIVTIPITIGAFSPLIILPHDLLADSNDEVLTSAIGHEMVHVRRRDYALNLVYVLLYLPLSFHPAAALIRRRIRQTRELSCDELVAERILNPEAYARSLVKLASSAPTLRRLSVTTIVGIADADILEARIMSLLKRPKADNRRMRSISIAASLLLLVPCMAVASFAMKFDLAFTEVAQDPTQQEKERRESENLKVQGRLTETQIKERQLREQLETLVTQDQTKQRQLREELKSLNDQDPAKALQLQEKLKAAVAEDQVEQQQLREQLKVLMESNSQDQTKERQDRELGQLRMKMESDPQFREEVRRKRETEMEMRGIKQSALVRLSRINMDQAIQIATSQVPGKVLNCNLDADKWEEPGKLAQDGKVFYRVVIVSSDDPNATVNHVWVNAVDGSLIKTEKELLRKMRSPEQ
jgi:beta-lactamase regulating signal transducer with metallopeptidase domain/uncharacterized membrane protein YkoI